MTLDELIAALETAPQRHRTLPLGFGNPHSYRGDYRDLVFEPLAEVTVSEMLAVARGALGATYEGWKGGDFTMAGYTDCWLANEGHGGGETIGPVLLSLMLHSCDLRAGACAELARFAEGNRCWGQG